MTLETASLLDPFSAEAPCGVDLEDSQLLATFDALRLFGRDRPLPSETPWRDIRDKALQALGQSRDLRLLAYLGAAVVRVDDLPGFCSVVTVMDRWLTEWWDAVFPRLTEDALTRKNALSCFADRMAVVDGLRRAPIVSHPQFGSFSVRDLELASGQLPPTELDPNPPTMLQIDTALRATPAEELSALSTSVAAAGAALRNVVATMQSRSGFEAAPVFDPLLQPLARIEKLLAEHLPAARTTERDTAAAPAAASEAVQPALSGAINSRQDAVRAIDAANAFFRRHEPSSPVPLLLDRAKRLVSKSFLEVLEDIAPDTLGEVRRLSGVRNEGNQ